MLASSLLRMSRPIQFLGDLEISMTQQRAGGGSVVVVWSLTCLKEFLGAMEFAIEHVHLV